MTITSSTPIIILHNHVGAHDPEDVQDILRQAIWIEQLLTQQGYSVQRLPFDLASLVSVAPRLHAAQAVVLNLVDASLHEEQLSYLVPGILSHLALSYTGCSLEALHLTTDKLVAKRLMHMHGIDTPDWIEPDEHKALQQGSYLVKPVWDDASIGIDDQSLVPNDGSDAVIREVMHRVRSTGKPHYAERFIDGREFTVCIYGSASDPIAMTPYEWVFQGFEERNLPRLFTFAAKWDESCYAFDHIVARYAFDESDAPLLQRLQQIALRCWNLFGLSGYARIDFRIDRDGHPWVLEANGNPSFYGFYHSAESSGTTFDAILEQIIAAAR